MTDEELEEIRYRVENHNPPLVDAFRIVACAADRIALLAEVDRLRAALARTAELAGFRITPR